MKKVIVFLLVSFYLDAIAQCVSPTIPVINSSTSTICSGQSVTLTITSGSLNSATNWQWYSGGCGNTSIGSGTQISVSPATSTNYFARGEGSCVIPGSCASISITVFQSPLVIATSTTQATCGNANGMASVFIGNGAPPYTYSWNTIPVQTNSTAINLFGTYSSTITDTQGCKATASVNITSAPLPSVTVVGSNILCFGQSNGSATLTASGVGGYSYQWIPGSFTTPIVNGLGNAIYTATVTDANGCKIFTTVNITSPNVLVLNVAPTQTICYGNIASIYAQASGGTLPYTYTLTNLATNSPTTITTPTGINATPNPTSTTQFTVSVKDGNGCTFGPSNIIVNVYPPLIASGYSVNACDGDAVILAPNITSVGNGGPYSYGWSNSTTAPTTSVIANFTNTPYAFSVVIDDACSIPNTFASFTVNVSACVGIKENRNNDEKISFSPNPANGLLAVDIDNMQEVVVAKLFSLIGKEVLSAEITNAKNTIDVSAINNGLYYLSIFNVANKKMVTEKILIQH